MGKKGLTLIELLAVLIILGVVLTIALPTIGDVILGSKDNLHDVTTKQLFKAAEHFLIEYKHEVSGLEETNFGYVRLDQLTDKGIIDEGLIDPKTGQSFPIGTAVKIEKLPNGTYKYELVMHDEEGPRVAFSPNGSNNYVKSLNVSVLINDQSGVDLSSLKRIWTSNAGLVPIESDFIATFSGSTIPTPNTATGDYYLWVLAKDNIGYTTIQGSNRFRLDNTPPTVTITGSNPVSINLGDPYSDEGATASDAHSGLSGGIQVVSNVNISIPGTYSVEYTTTDKAGNVTTVVRTVNVIDNEFPVVTFNPIGNETYAKTRNSIVTATDNGGIDGSSLKYQWTTSTTPPTEPSFSLTFTNGSSISSPAGVTGDYYLWIIAKDIPGNTTIARSNRFRLDNIIPVITMNPPSPITIGTGQTYVDPGATASDNINGDLTSSIVPTSNVNINVPGTYYVNYNVSDSSGNAATQVTRTVIVQNVAPSMPGAFATLGHVFRNMPKTLSWGATSSWGHPSTSPNYRLEVQYDGGSWTFLQNTGTTSNYSHTVPSGNISIRYRVRAESNGGVSDYSYSTTVNLKDPIFTFTNAGKTGREGPTQTQVNTAYSGTSLEGTVTVYSYNYNYGLITGLQEWEIPASGNYTIEVWGAQGGGTQGGLGARMRGNFYLTAGQRLRIIVGQRGTALNVTNAADHGGGGGSFVTVIDSGSSHEMIDGIRVTPLIIAGGGGGSDSACSGRHATTSTNGNSASSGQWYASAGTNGSGGHNMNSGSGGGGFLRTEQGSWVEGFLQYGRGCSHWGSLGAHSAGGYGGGACGILYNQDWYSSVSAGGGGYSGGGAAGRSEWGQSNYTCGGGGGSYNIGTSQSNTGGVRTGDGQGIITYIGP
jgi:prepilin-type N-terminal cleavage/methylation domain-containing protein